MEDRDWLMIKLLYKHKNITKTAQALFVSQPALTTRIRQIEEDFGIKMIQRSSRGVYFTSEGEYLALYADKMLTDMRSMRETLANLGNEVKGTLRLGASIYFTRYKLPRLLRLFKDRYPSVDFKIITALSKDILSLMSNQDLQVGFVRGDYGWHAEKHVLFEEPMCIVSKNEFSLQNLPNLPRIDYPTNHSYKILIDKWWGENFSQPPIISMSVNQVDVCKDMVINGFGYAILPSMILNDAEGLYKIYITDSDGKRILRKTWIVYQKESLEIRLVNVFVNFVKTLDFNTL